MKMLAAIALAAVAQPASAQLISAQIDYPPAEFLEGIQGAVRYEVELTATGTVTKCRVVETSGNANLDKATCQQLRRTGHFKPSVDGTGAPVASTYSGEMRWTLEPKQ